MVASFIRFQCKQTTHCLSELQTSRTHNAENTRKICALVKELRFRTDAENIFLRSKVWAPINQLKGEMLLVWCPPFQMGSTQLFLLLLLPLTNLFQYIQTSGGPIIMTHNICRRWHLAYKIVQYISTLVKCFSAVLCSNAALHGSSV